MSAMGQAAALAQAVGEAIAGLPITVRAQATLTPTARWKSFTVALPVPLDASRGLQTSVRAGASTGSGAMVVGTAEGTSGVIEQIIFRYASIPSDFGASTAIQFEVTGYPA